MDMDEEPEDDVFYYEGADKVTNTTEKEDEVDEVDSDFADELEEDFE